MGSLRGKTAIITGGSRGIGLAIAQHFARLGASTILVGRDNVTLRAAVESIKNQPSSLSSSSQASTLVESSSSAQPFHNSIQGDVSHPQTWESLLAELAQGTIGPSTSSPSQQKQQQQQHKHPIDVLVNCAGVSQSSLLARTSLDEITNILDTNLKSAVLGCKYIGTYMMRTIKAQQQQARRERGNSADGSDCNSGSDNGNVPLTGTGPSIINVSSVMAMRGGAGAAVYAATKAGLLGLTSSLSGELGQFGIRVNALVPGYIDTPMIQNFNRDALTRHIPLKRTGLASEVADAAAFLAQNAYANNCVLTIDGGLTASILSNSSKSEP